MSDVEISLASLSGMTDRFDLVTGFLTLRNAVFRERMGWPLAAWRGLEFEQYDRADAVYCIAHRAGDVVGGARLLRTDRRASVAGGGSVSYSYMIRDAWLGLLPGLPPQMSDCEPPTDPETWELSRLVVDGGGDIGARVLAESYGYIGSVGARFALCLGSLPIMRLAGRLGYAPQAMGPVVRNEDGPFRAFSCSVQQ